MTVFKESLINAQTLQLCEIDSIVLTENELDGESLSAALSQGPESIKEAIPSLSKRLKLLGAIKVLQASSLSINQTVSLFST